MPLLDETDRTEHLAHGLLGEGDARMRFFGRRSGLVDRGVAVVLGGDLLDLTRILDVDVVRGRQRIAVEVLDDIGAHVVLDPLERLIFGDELEPLYLRVLGDHRLERLLRRGAQDTVFKEHPDLNAVLERGRALVEVLVADQHGAEDRH
jgi:hypothetical protein